MARKNQASSSEIITEGSLNLAENLPSDTSREITEGEAFLIKNKLL